MAIRYKKSILMALREAGYSTYHLRKEKIFGEAIMQQFRSEAPIATITGVTLDKLCRLLKCQPGDLLEYIESPDDDSKPEISPESESYPAAQETSTEAMKRIAHEMEIARAYGVDPGIVYDRPKFEELLLQGSPKPETGLDVMKRSAAEAQEQKEQGLKEEAARRDMMAVFHEDMSDSDE